MMTDRQTTLRASKTLEGHGVHSGAPAAITLRPASPNQGIVFVRKGLADGVESGDPRPFRWRDRHRALHGAGQRCGSGGRTVEHLMSAFAGLGVDNAMVEIGGPEMPIMDGSAAIFVEAIEEIGLARQNEARRYIKVLRPVRIEDGKGYCELLPAEEGSRSTSRSTTTRP